jgi:hypothetical protein
MRSECIGVKGERSLHTGEAVGSIPTAPTIILWLKSAILSSFLPCTVAAGTQWALSRALCPLHRREAMVRISALSMSSLASALATALRREWRARGWDRGWAWRTPCASVNRCAILTSSSGNARTRGLPWLTPTIETTRAPSAPQERSPAAASSCSTRSQGQTAELYSDGTNIVPRLNWNPSMALGSPLPVSSGGGPRRRRRAPRSARC